MNVCLLFLFCTMPILYLKYWYWYVEFVAQGLKGNCESLIYIGGKYTIEAITTLFHIFTPIYLSMSLHQNYISKKYLISRVWRIIRYSNTILMARPNSSIWFGIWIMFIPNRIRYSFFFGTLNSIWVFEYRSEYLSE